MRRIDQIKNSYPLGHRTGNLIVEGYEKYEREPHFWMLQLKCDCGSKIRLRPGQLPENKTKSCGCLVSSYFDTKFKEKYPVGTTFGNLTVKGYEITPRHLKSRNGSTTERRIVCECSCGKTTSVRASSAARGATTSCGCVGIKKRAEGMRKQ